MSATGLRVDLRASGPFPVDTFDKALNEALGHPGDDAPWRRLEETAAADEAQSRRLLDAYRAQLGTDLPRPLHDLVARRAVRFAADCFGENAPESIDVLRAVLATAADADWAFRPLVVALTMAERWGEVLDAYDARLAAGRGDDQRAELLGEAARIAKDFTRDGARAIGYLDRLFRMRPLDAQVASSLERLLERDRRWTELCAVWRLRLEALTGEEAGEQRLRLATVLCAELGQPAEAVAVLRPLLTSGLADAPAALTELLEQIFLDRDGRAPTETRLEVLDALRGHLLAAGRAARVAELLAVAIDFSQGERLQALRRECGERRRALGDIAGAIEQYVALSALVPEDREIEDRLRQLAELGGDPAALVRGLTAAGRATAVDERRVELLMRAARVEDRQPGRKAAAAELFAAAAGEPRAPLEVKLEALRRLEALHEELGDVPARLEALERLAAAEPQPADRRMVWARAAELARSRGDVDRALRAWNGRLEADPADAEALAASRALLQEAQRWPALIDLLRRRIACAPADHQIRADLEEIAALARARTRDLPTAIAAWRDVAARFGEDDACVDALVDLLAESGRFPELGELLTRRAGVDRSVHAGRLARLGDTLREKLDDARGAIGWYACALEVEPAQERARAGLTALLAEEALAPLAAAPLAAAAERTDGWQLLLELLPHRLAALETSGARARLLQEAAALAEERAGDPARAFEWLCQALPEAGENLALVREVLRLGEATGGAARAAEALAGAIAAGGWAPLPLAHLHERRGALLEENVGDLAGARASYEAALAITPERLGPRRRALGVAVRLGDLPAAAALLVEAAVSPATRANVLLPLYESMAREARSLPAAAAALARAADQAPDLEPSARREVHARVAATLLGECQDPAAADAALARALGADPGHVPTLRQRADLQRAQGGDGLVQTLRRLAEEQPNDLLFLREAAAVALATSDETSAVEILGRLAERATRLAQLDVGGGGAAALDAAAHAIDESVRLHVAAGGADRVRRATALLLEGARLPAAAETRRGWLRRAAELTEEQLGDTGGAIRIWRTLAEEAPADTRAREALARLYERERRFADATSLRLAELEGTGDGARRLALRLEIVRLAGLLEKQSDAPEVLRANLAERPGHAETVKRLAEVMLAKGKPADLADVYQQQATILAEEGQPSDSAALWAELARLSEKRLGDPRRAAAAWAEVAEREATTEALDALGRLALDAGEASAAAGWLDRRLAMTEGPARVEVAGALATAHLAAGQRHRAIACLERVLGDAPQADSLRDRLAGLYREAESWEPLARVLADGCQESGDEAVVVARAREAAEVYTRLGMLARAVPVLEHAVRLLPRDEGLRLALADGLAQSGQRAEARRELLALVEQAGWRKTRKRAALHQRLGELARLDGDLPRALTELEQASSMDASSTEILRQLAEVAEAAGAVAQAERAYRALLVRRTEGGSGPAATELLLRLFGLARKRGDGAEADELLESALAAAFEDADEARSLQQALLARGEHELLDRVFAKRLARLAGTTAQAEVYAEQAESLRAQKRLEEAFEAQLSAVEAAPERESFHEPLLVLGREAGKTDVLVDRLLALVERRRRKTETGVAAVLLLRVAEIAERDLGDGARSLELLRRAEEVEPRSLAVLAGLGRLAAARRDEAECDRIAARLEELAAEAATPVDAAEALYRAAALELPREATRDAGIAKLCVALEKHADLDRASALVEAAGLSQGELVKILPLYERIARRSGDERLLLDYLERRAATPEITVAEAREAVDLAVALGEPARVEPLLVRLAEVGAKDPEGRRDAAWASLELVQRRKATGDLEGAVAALERAVETNVVDADRFAALARELGERAAKAGQHRLGATLLERLRAQSPADETLWRPLLAHYVALNDRAALERVVEETLPLLPEVERRNQLRLARARVLLGDDERDPAAAELLRDMLLDEPRNAEALALLAGYYERTGAEDDLRDLLEQRFEAALEAREPSDVVEAALRLGRLLEGADAARAVALYERALGVAKGRRQLLERLIAVRGGEATVEYAKQMEELLAAETGPEAVGLVQEIAALWRKLGDQSAVRRVLERGHQLAPADEAIATELDGLYRGRKSWSLLAGLLKDRAAHEPNAEHAVPLLLEAATLLETELADAAGALAVLRTARERQPENVEVVEALARLLAAGGEVDAAVAEVTAAIAASGKSIDPSRRLRLSLSLADMEGARRNHRAAVAELRGIVELAPDVVAERLQKELEAWRTAAARAGAPAELRAVTLELAEQSRRRGDIAGARRMTTELLESAEPDAELLRLHAELAEADGDVAGAVDATYNLMQLEQGAAQVAAANRLVELAARANRTADATAAIEQMVTSDPNRQELVDLLARLYEKAGEKRKLAALLYDAASRAQEDDQRFALLRRAGGVSLEVGDGSLAIMALSEALAIRPGDEETGLLASDAYVLAGALDEAAATLKPFVAAYKGKASPALAVLHARLARIAAAAGDAREELAALTRALDADKKNGPIMCAVADRAEAAGDLDLALKALRLITANNAPGPISLADAFLRQARIAERKGERERALMFARRAAQEAPKGDPIQRAAREMVGLLEGGGGDAPAPRTNRRGS
jgi:thioredoxin-like negative regulator of GroEL